VAEPIGFWIPGVPQPAGSKRAFPIKRANGSIGVAVTDANPTSRSWKNDVAHAALSVVGGGYEPLRGPLSLRVTFNLPRPKSHYGAKGLKPGSPRWHTSKPDATKLLRGVEDALTGILWGDDAQVSEQHVTKVYTSGASGVRIEVLSLSPEPCEVTRTEERIQP
jgi:Holliday junction resolvase RusA-like endonuclease